MIEDRLLSFWSTEDGGEVSRTHPCSINQPVFSRNNPHIIRREINMTKPLIAVTMGDPTGIGPEIIARALARPEIGTDCRALVLGDRSAMERGITVTGERLRLETLSEGVPPVDRGPGTIYLRPLSHLGAADLVYGNPTIASGEAMFRYITEAARL